MKNFAAIDFETANQQRTSICSVGIVIVRNGEIVDSYYSLIKPEPEYYSYWNTRVHGLTIGHHERQGISRGMGWDSAKDWGIAIGSSQLSLWRGMPEVCVPNVSNGLSRLWVPLHMPSLQKKVGISPTQPPTTNRSCLLRVRPNPTPQCTRWRRGLCLDCQGTTITLTTHFNVFCQKNDNSTTRELLSRVHTVKHSFWIGT